MYSAAAATPSLALAFEVVCALVMTEALMEVHQGRRDPVCDLET